MHKLCTIKVDMSAVGLDKFDAREAPDSSPGFEGRPYYYAPCQLKVIIGAADLKFEVWFKGIQYGEKYIDVEWGRFDAT